MEIHHKNTDSNNTKVYHDPETLRIEQLYTGIAKSITSSLEIEKVIKAIMEQIEIYFCPNNWSLLRLDPHTQELYFIITKGLDEDIKNSVRLKLGEGIAGHVAQTGKSVFIHDTKEDKNFSDKIDHLSGFKTESLIAVPIIFQNKILGVIEIVNPTDKNKFTSHELNILETIADFSAIALENAITHEKMAWISVHDPLTKIYNREKYEELVQMCNVIPAADNDEHVIIIGVDANNFKYINDTYGHAAGDKVLVQIAKILQSYCRRNDYAFRVGGDEFLMILMDLKKHDVKSISNRIKNNLLRDSQNLDYNCSFSFGIASGLKSNLQQLIKIADDMMYENKTNMSFDKL